MPPTRRTGRIAMEGPADELLDTEIRAEGEDRYFVGDALRTGGAWNDPAVVEAYLGGHAR